MFLKGNGKMTKHSYWAPFCLFNHLGLNGHPLFSHKSPFLPVFRTDSLPSDAGVCMRIRIAQALGFNIWEKGFAYRDPNISR